MHSMRCALHRRGERVPEWLGTKRMVGFVSVKVRWGISGHESARSRRPSTHPTPTRRDVAGKRHGVATLNGPGGHVANREMRVIGHGVGGSRRGQRGRGIESAGLVDRAMRSEDQQERTVPMMRSRTQENLGGCRRAWVSPKVSHRGRRHRPIACALAGRALATATATARSSPQWSAWTSRGCCAVRAASR